MKTHTKLLLGGIVLIVFPALILAGAIIYQLSLMSTPSAEYLNLRWAFVAFYAMTGGLVMLIFSNARKKQYLKEEEHRKLKEKQKSDSK